MALNKDECALEVQGDGVKYRQFCKCEVILCQPLIWSAFDLVSVGGRQIWESVLVTTF